MKLASIYAHDKDSAIFLLEKGDDNVVHLLEYWRSSPEERDPLDAARRMSKGVTTVINSDVIMPSSSKLMSGLGTVLQASGVSITNVVPSFQPNAGITALAALRAEDRIDTSKIDIWPRIEDEINQSRNDYSVLVRAMFQGLIDIAFTDYTHMPLRGVQIKAVEGYEAMEWINR